MEHQITPQKVTLKMLKSLFGKYNLKRNINKSYLNYRFLTSQSRNVPNLFFFYQFQCRFSYKVGSYKRKAHIHIYLSHIKTE